jgi:tight adherence protein B
VRTVFILLVSAGLVVVLEAVFLGARYLVARRSQELKRRLQALGKADADSGLLRQGRFAASPALDSVLRAMPLARQTEKLLESADSRLTVARLWTYSAALAGAVLVAGMALQLGLVPVLAPVAAAAVGPTLFFSLAAGRRSRELSEQLPEALDMLSRSLRAGHAISGALQMVATEMPSPVNVEFGRAFEEQRLGLSLDQAILHMTQRAPSNQDLKIFVVSVLIQKETGGNLAEILQGIGETIRARYRFQGKLRAITAEGRASGLIISLLPLVFVAVQYVINPGYILPLVRDPRGHLILAYAFVTWAVGVTWIRRLTKVGI